MLSLQPPTITAPASDERVAMMWWAMIAASLLAVIGCAYVIVALLLVGRFVRQTPSPAPSTIPGITILKPLYRDEPGLYENLASFCRQDYPGPVQIIFGVQDAGDSAIAVVERLRQANPDAEQIGRAHV